MKRNLLITCVMLLFAVVSMAQNKITVSGVVTDKTGETVIGASVREKDRRIWELLRISTENTDSWRTGECHFNIQLYWYEGTGSGA